MGLTSNYSFVTPEMSTTIVNIVSIVANALNSLDKVIYDNRFKGQEFTTELKDKLIALQNFDATSLTNNILAINGQIESINSSLSASETAESEQVELIGTIQDALSDLQTKVNNISIVLDNDNDGSIFDAISDLISMIDSGDADLISLIASKATQTDLNEVKASLDAIQNTLNNFSSTSFIKDYTTGYVYEIMMSEGTIIASQTDKSRVQSAYDTLIINSTNRMTDIVLPGTENSCIVTWTTADASVVTATGTITRPAYGEEATETVLTATISYNGEVMIKAFTASVLPLTAAEQLITDVAALTVGGLDAVIGDITLPSSVGYSSVTWVSSDHTYMGDDGTIISLPVEPEADKTLTLTATITLDMESHTKDFTVTILAREKTDAEKVSAAIASLSLGDTTNVVSDIVLPSTSGDTTISWASSNEAVVTTGGIVSRPLYGEQDINVTLTATVSLNTESDTKAFTIIVAPLSDSEQLIKDKAELTLGDISAITSAITLPLVQGLATIVWVSTDETIIATDGTVVQPEPGVGDASITLTATLTVNGISDIKTFYATVLEREMTDEEKVSQAVDNLDLGDTSAIVENLTLPSSQDEASITWASSDVSVVTAEGIVIRPDFGTGDMTITLTATLTVNAASNTKDFSVTVLEDISDAAKVASATAALSLGDISGISSDITLPISQDECSVSWSSDNISIIDVDGTVTQPAYLDGNATVTLTATISLGIEVDTKDFVVIVIAAAATDAELVTEAKTNLDLGDISAITDNMTFTTSQDSAFITWASSDETIIGTDGTVTRPLNGEGDAIVTLTATITVNAEFDTKEFIVTVLELDDLTDAEKLVIATSNLDLGDTSAITSDLTLPLTQDSAIVSWSSDDQIHLSDSGTVLRPLFGEGNATVNLTATISVNAESTTKAFVVVIIETPEI